MCLQLKSHEIHHVILENQNQQAVQYAFSLVRLLKLHYVIVGNQNQQGVQNVFTKLHHIIL